jgi:hypothetical protein
MSLLVLAALAGGIIAALCLGALALRFALRAHRLASAARENAPDAAWRAPLEALEQRLAQRIEMTLQLVLVQSNLLSQMTRSGATRDEGVIKPTPQQRPEVEETPLPEAVATAAQSSRPGQHVPSSQQAETPAAAMPALGKVLEGSEFRDTLWPRLVGDFDTVSRELQEFLRAQGLTQVELEPYPPLHEGTSNHWEFVIAQPRQQPPDGRSFLLPRSFGRYDPLFHSHLFKAEAQPSSSDLFFRQLIRCAELRWHQGAGGAIDRDRVLNAGEIRVEPPRR